VFSALLQQVTRQNRRLFHQRRSRHINTPVQSKREKKNFRIPPLDRPTPARPQLVNFIEPATPDLLPAGRFFDLMHSG
jgi:hypothetical protein